MPAAYSYGSNQCRFCSSTEAVEIETELCLQCRLLMQKPAESLVVSVPPQSAEQARKSQLVAEHEMKEILSVSQIPCDAAYTAVDAMLTEVVRDKDAAKAMQKQVTGPLYQVIGVVGTWFRPWIAARESAETHLKKLMGDYRLARAEAEASARETAAAAASANDSATMVQALATAADAAQRPESAATVRYVWRVERIATDMLPAEWWCPDVARIEQVAKDQGGDPEPPVIPGVVFKREAIIGAKR
jgi:hypothetical protein